MSTEGLPGRVVLSLVLVDTGDTAAHDFIGHLQMLIEWDADYEEAIKVLEATIDTLKLKRIQLLAEGN